MINQENKIIWARPDSPRPNRLGAKALGTSVLEYRFCSTRQYLVLILLKSTSTQTCTQVLLKMKVLLTSTYEYFTSTSHLKLIQNSSQTNHKSLYRDIKHSVNDSFSICLDIILKNYLINTFEIISD